jgi:hypothetical protein
LAGLSRRIVNLQCECPPAIAAARYSQRRRHPGHLDQSRSPEDVLASIEALAGLTPLEIGVRVRCDTSSEVDLSCLAMRIAEAFDRL